ncbi:helicase, partial [filamentous cyanobacterium CCP5]
MIEAEVHYQLRDFLRKQGQPYWPHHLTLARLVARALRLGRSALIQAGSSSVHSGRYRLSYLISILIWPGAAVVVATEAVQRQLLSDLAYLQDWVPTYKPVQRGDTWPHPQFQGLLLTTPESWLADRLGPRQSFPKDIPTIIDGADDLEQWVQDQLTVTLTQADWEALALAFPDQQQLIRD